MNQISLTAQCQAKIREDIFSLFNTPQLLGKFRMPQVNQGSNQVEIYLHHMENKTQLIRFIFNQKYPNEPPLVKLFKSSVPQFFCFSQKLRPGIWTPTTKLSDVILDIYQNIDKFHLSQKLVNDNFQIGSPPQLKIEKHQRKRNTSMNGCSDRQMTQTKNLNRHFRSKLRDVLKDMGPQKNHTQDYKIIEEMFTPNRVGFEDIRKVLKNQWFRKGVNDQIISGRFLNKILTGMMGIKSKKLMIKYYHVMISAARDPDTFIRWKYD